MQFYIERLCCALSGAQFQDLLSYQLKTLSTTLFGRSFIWNIQIISQPVKPGCGKQRQCVMFHVSIVCIKIIQSNISVFFKDIVNFYNLDRAMVKATREKYLNTRFALSYCKQAIISASNTPLNHFHFEYCVANKRSFGPYSLLCISHRWKHDHSAAPYRLAQDELFAYSLLWGRSKMWHLFPQSLNEPMKLFLFNFGRN